MGCGERGRGVGGRGVDGGGVRHDLEMKTATIMTYGYVRFFKI